MNKIKKIVAIIILAVSATGIVYAGVVETKVGNFLIVMTILISILFVILWAIDEVRK